MKRIIIVDDDSAIQDSIGMVFNPDEYHVTIYPDADYILEDKFDLPDIFIIDKQLAGADGLDVCRHLKANPQARQIPVIMMSASPSIGILAKAAGADDFIEKPYTLKQLREMVVKYTTPAQE